jgi:hypothetical protein
MLWVEDFLLGAAERFHAALAALPQWEEPLNSQTMEHCDGLGQWVRTLDDWSFESERYFWQQVPRNQGKHMDVTSAEGNHNGDWPRAH